MIDFEWLVIQLVTLRVAADMNDVDFEAAINESEKRLIESDGEVILDESE